MDVEVLGTKVDAKTVQALDEAIARAGKDMQHATFRAAHHVADITQDVSSTPSSQVIVGFRHLVHPGKNWTVLATLEDAVQFLAYHIDPDRGEGLDLCISCPSFDHLWITSHDGDGYRLK